MLLKTLLFSAIVAALLTPSVFAQGNFVYTNNGGTLVNTVSGFSVEVNGTLTSVAGSPFPTGAPSVGFGNDIEASSLGNLLFVSNDRDVNGSSVSAFSINPNTGFLTPVPGSPFATGTGIPGGLSLELTSDNQFLIAANTATSKIAVFSVGSNGVLTPVAGSPFSASNIVTIEISPDGRFLFVAQEFSPRLTVFSIGSNGALIPVVGSPFTVATEGDITSLETNCAGTLLFAADDTGQVFVFNISSTGTPTQMLGSPFSVSDFVGTQKILLNPSGNLLFVSNTTAAAVSTFDISPTGGLTLVPGSVLFIGDSNNEDRRPVDLSINQEGNLLYVMNADSTIHVLNIAANGLLTLVPGSPFVNPGGSGGAAMLAAFPPKNCSAPPNFDLCIQDDSSGYILNINSATGDYQFTDCSGFSVVGVGSVIKKGGIITLQHNASDRRVSARINTSAQKGTASIQVFSQGATYTLIDRNSANNTCTCTAG